jgi:prepilin-type N-terminal cleavage/methylation domain-containing protein
MEKRNIYADKIKGLCAPMKETHGFSLIEVLLALILLSAALLAAAQLTYATASSSSLARSKITAAMAARQTIERLSALYERAPLAEDLTIGDHGPRQIEYANPLNATTLNRYNIFWNVNELSDPRPDKQISGRIVQVTIMPQNKQARFNKILFVTAVLSPKAVE